MDRNNVNTPEFWADKSAYWHKCHKDSGDRFHLGLATAYDTVALYLHGALELVAQHDKGREKLRSHLMKHFSEKLSMDEIGNCVYDAFPALLRDEQLNDEPSDER